MTLDEAIKILKDKLKHPYSQTRLAYPNALKLGIEALMCIQELKNQDYPGGTLVLLGETEE